MKVLIIEDDVAFGKMLSSFMERKGFEVEVALSGTSARELLSNKTFDLLISDLKLPDDSGLQLLEYSKKMIPGIKVILMTVYADVGTAVEAIKKGALDYISKPFRPEELLMIIEEGLKEESSKNQKRDEVAIKPEASDKRAVPNSNVETSTSGFVTGISESSKKLKEYLKLVGPTNMNVLIQGESGTGKEVAAKAIHNYSVRKSNNFVAVDCGAIPKEIAASEFFGHVKGSFTGAINDKQGHFETAHKGTLFLDEVGNLSYENQIQLLRALQEKKIKPVGSSKEIDVDIRILTATNEDLVQAVKEGKFREDLYHRLNEFSIFLPPLRERKDDLFMFIQFFLDEANQSLNKEVLGLTKEVEQAFRNYSWPGNLRELKNVIKRSVLLTTGSTIPLQVIPSEVVNYNNSTEDVMDFSKDSNEKQLIINALKQTDNNKSRAAKLLNITRKTLYNKLARYKLNL